MKTVEIEILILIIIILVVVCAALIYTLVQEKNYSERIGVKYIILLRAVQNSYQSRAPVREFLKEDKCCMAKRVLEDL